MRVVCLIAIRWRGRSGSSAIQQTSASTSWVTCGALAGRQIRSPRETSRSSSSRTVTAIGANASSTGPRGPSMRGDRRRQAAGQHLHLVARAQHAAGHGAGVAAVVVERVATAGGSTYCTGKRGVDQVAVAGHVHVLEVVQQRRPLVPGGVRRAGDDVVAVERRDRDDGQVGHVQLRREGGELVADRLVDVLRPVDEVHLVDRDDEVRHPQQRGEERVPAALLEHALAGVDQHDREVGGRGAGDHVPRVLHVAGGVGEDERAPRRREVPVGDVDRDALLALGAQAVGEQREVDVVALAGPLDRLVLVLEDRPCCRRAAGRSACSCRRRRSRRWRSAGCPCARGRGRARARPWRSWCGLQRVTAIRSSPPSSGPPWRPR